MPKIVQKINIQDGILTAASGGTGLGIAGARLDWNNYSGTTSFYFEIVAKTAASSNVTVALRQRGTSTDDATVTVTTAMTSYTRIRSSSFTPALNPNLADYVVFINTSTGGATDVKAARIIITQDTPSIVATDTVIEVGNQETGKTNTVSAPLTYPKYWLYDSTKWDATTGFLAEVCFITATSKNTCTITLQSDNGAFGAWADAAIIASAQYSTPGARVRSGGFSPTSGRNFRISSRGSTTKSSYGIYNAKVLIQSRATADQSQITVTSSLPIYGGTGTNEACSQSFQPSATAVHTGMAFQINTVGSPTDNIQIDVRSSHGGASLASGSVPYNRIPSISGFWIWIPFTTPVSLTASTTYYTEITRTGARDATNSYEVSLNAASNDYANGQAEKRDSGSWSAQNYDLAFRTLTTPVTKIETAELIVNTNYSTTGLTDFDIYYDPAEWSGVQNTYYNEGYNVASGTEDLKLQSDPNGTPADVTNSTITDCIERERSASMTMPGSAKEIDTYFIAGTSFRGNALVIQVVVSAATDVSQAQAAYLKGLESINQAQVAFLRGLESLSQAQAAFLLGAEPVSQGQAAYLRGLESLTQGQSAYLLGLESWSQAQAGYLRGLESLSQGQPAYLEGAAQSISQGVTAFLLGLEALAQTQAAYLASLEAVSQTQAAYLAGAEAVSQGQVAYLNAIEGVVQTQSAYLRGLESLNSGQTAYLAAYESWSQSAPAYLHGLENLLQGQSSYLRGQESIAQGQIAYLYAIEGVIQSVTAYLKGLESLSQGQAAYLLAMEIWSQSQTSYLKGLENVSLGQTAYLRSLEPIALAQFAFLAGAEAVASGQIAYLKGAQPISQAQPAYLFAQAPPGRPGNYEAHVLRWLE